MTQRDWAGFFGGLVEGLERSSAKKVVSFSIHTPGKSVGKERCKKSLIDGPLAREEERMCVREKHEYAEWECEKCGKLCCWACAVRCVDDSTGEGPITCPHCGEDGGYHERRKKRESEMEQKEVIRKRIDLEWSSKRPTVDWLQLEEVLVRILSSLLVNNEKVALSKEAIDAFTRRGHFELKEYE